MQKDLTLEIAVWGSVFDARVYLEGHEIKLWQTDSARKIKFRKLPHFDILGETLDVVVETEGKNGSSVTLTVIADDTTLGKITCVNEGGRGKETESYRV